MSLYSRKRVEIREPAVLIRINELYRYDMTDAELYDATRGVWRIGEPRERASYALAVYEGVVLEVYRIARWLPAGSTFSTRSPAGIKSSGRWEFVGTVAEERIRKRYRDRYVGHLFSQGAQNPIAYVNVDR
ncbi:MAG: hypothetical protein HY721_06275 [Planctomycetes bacterium]|nr:hypothetical protein [Planctomycetota bacterium]